MVNSRLTLHSSRRLSARLNLIVRCNPKNERETLLCSRRGWHGYLLPPLYTAGFSSVVFRRPVRGSSRHKRDPTKTKSASCKLHTAYGLRANCNGRSRLFWCCRNMRHYTLTSRLAYLTAAGIAADWPLTPNPPVERDRQPAALVGSLRGFAAPAAPHLARWATPKP